MAGRQPDPVLPNPYDPQALNRYAYVRNNPLKYTDPTGHIFWVPAQLYAISVLTSPDFNTDMAQLQMSGSDFAANPNAFTALGVGIDLADTLLPAISLPGSAVGKGAKAAVKQGSEALSNGIKATDRAVKTLADMPKPGVMLETTGQSGWKIGEAINNLTKSGKQPSWSSVRSRLWKNEALYNAGEYTTKSLERMKKGMAPEYFSRGEGRSLPFELDHNPYQREGGLFNVRKVTKEEHVAQDKYRY